MQPHRKGEVTEAAVITELKKRNIPVSIPFGDNEPYDILAETSRGRILRLQIKTAKHAGDHLRFKGIRQHTNSTGNVRKRYVDEIDYFLVYCHELQEMYLVEEGAVGSQMRLRLEDPKQDHHSINWATNYEFDARWPPNAKTSKSILSDDTVEAVVLALQQLGVTVLRNFGEENTRKLVAIHNDVPIRIRVESGPVVSGRIRFPAEGDDIDCYLVYVADLNQVYAVDVDEFDESISLRVEEPDQPDSSINWAEDYELERNWPPWRDDDPRQAMYPGVRATVEELEARGHEVQYPGGKSSRTLVVNPGAGPISLRVASAWNEQGRLHFDPGEADVDYHIVYYRDRDELYLVSDDAFKMSITLRVDPPEKADPSINWADEYAFESAWPPDELA